MAVCVPCDSNFVYVKEISYLLLDWRILSVAFTCTHWARRTIACRCTLIAPLFFSPRSNTGEGVARNRQMVSVMVWFKCTKLERNDWVLFVLTRKVFVTWWQVIQRHREKQCEPRNQGLLMHQTGILWFAPKVNCQLHVNKLKTKQRLASKIVRDKSLVQYFSPLSLPSLFPWFPAYKHPEPTLPLLEHSFLQIFEYHHGTQDSW